MGTYSSNTLNLVGLFVVQHITCISVIWHGKPGRRSPAVPCNTPRWPTTFNGALVPAPWFLIPLRFPSIHASDKLTWWSESIVENKYL